MHIRFVALFAALFAAALPSLAAQPAPPPVPAAKAPVSLDPLAGRWTIHDPSGKPIGASEVRVQAEGVALFEERRIDGDSPQPLWFMNSERDRGWVQLFVGALGQVRAFTTQSPAGEWPLVLGGDVVLRDGTPVTFRLTMQPEVDGRSRRHLERSADRGASWSTVFDYDYRRVR